MPSEITHKPSRNTATRRALRRVRSSTLGRLVYRFRWLIPVASFVIGISSYFLVHRQNMLAQWLTMLMMLGWVVFVFEGLLRRFLARLLGENLPLVLLRYAAQSLHQETLFFVLPFFLATTVWWSGQIFFTGLLLLAAIASVIDPIYNGIITSRRSLFFGYHALTLFAAVLTAGPIIGSMTTGESIATASIVMAVCALPSISDVVRVRNWSRWLVLVALSIALGIGAWMARAWIPPATLDAKYLVITNQLNASKREPGKALEHISVNQLKGNGLYAFSSIKAPRGLHQKVLHIWRHNGQIVSRIPLTIEGGSRASGYRTWSHVTHFGSHPSGIWQVDVLTHDGQLIGRKRFAVTSGGQ